MQFESSSFLGHLTSWAFILLLSLGIISFNFDLSQYLNNEFWTKTIIATFFSIPILGAVVCWRNSEPENQGFFSKLKSLFSAGFWLVFFSAIALFPAVLILQPEEIMGRVLFFVPSCLLFLMSISANTKTFSGNRRGLADALAMSLGQSLIILVIFLIIAQIFGRRRR